MKIILNFFILNFMFVACNAQNNGGELFETSGEDQLVVGDPPVTSNITPTNIQEDIESIIVLTYSDPNSDLATNCTVSNLVNLDETTPCSCDAMGVCTVGITANNYGTASFDYGVLANTQVSNISSASMTIDSPFISVWNIASANETITLPLRNPYNYNFTVDWGDGSAVDTVTAWNDANATHTYISAGQYTITINGIVETIYFYNKPERLKIISIPNLGNVGWISFNGAFRGCTNLTTVLNGNTEQVTNMNAMFYQNTLVEPEGTSWKTSNVTDMANMFYQAKEANPDTENWNTANVTNMYYMFFDAIKATPNTSNWNTANVTNMGGMFRDADIANPDTSNWDTSNVTNMSAMFRNTNEANPNTTNWNTSKVTTMAAMFNIAKKANPDTSNFDISNVTNLGSMFYGATVANPNTTNWDTSNVTNFNSLFCNAPNANPDVSNWNTSSVTNMGRVFWKANSANPDLDGWDTSNVTDMSYMFYQNPNIPNPNIENWDVSKVTTMLRMFAISASAPDLSNWDFSSVTNMSLMFYSNNNMSVAAYSAFLNQVDATSAQVNVTLDGGANQYDASASTARANLVADGWTITDGGLAP